MSFYKLKDYDGLAGMDSKMLQVMIEDFVMTKKSEGLSRAGILNYMAPLEVFCDCNDIEIKWKKIHRLFPQREKKSGGKPYTTDQITTMLEFETGIRNKALVNFIAASGVRVGAISPLNLEHVIDFKEGCKMIKVYDDSKDEYITFLTPEASEALEFYLTSRRKDGEYLTPKSPLFRTKYLFGSAKAKRMQKPAIIAVIDRVLRRSKLRVGSSKKRYDTQIDHGFRKRWNTIVKNTDGMKIFLAEKMMGHSITIPLDDTYNIPNEEKLFAEYRKAIPELTISSKARDQALLDIKTKEVIKLEKALAEKDDLLVRVAKLEAKSERSDIINQS